MIVALRRQTRACEIDDPGYSDSWEGLTAGQRIGVARSNLNSNANLNAKPSEVDSRSELGCLAASVSCWSCPHQVGEGNLLLRAPESLGPQGEVRLLGFKRTSAPEIPPGLVTARRQCDRRELIEFS